MESEFEILALLILFVVACPPAIYVISIVFMFYLFYRYYTIAIFAILFTILVRRVIKN